MRGELGHESRGRVNGRARCAIGARRRYGGSEMSQSQSIGMSEADAPSRLQAVRREIAQACAQARRDPAEVTFVAVSKTFGVDAIAPVLAAGQAVFGENRVQE